MTSYEVISLIIGSVTAIILIIQLRVLIITLKADHERRKKQSTLENAANIVREARQIIQQEFGNTRITEENINQLKNDNKLLAKINNAFGVFEHISVGLAVGVYDADLFFRMFSKTFVEIFDQYCLYIEFRRKNHGNTTYSEFENLVIDYRRERELNPNSNGNIKQS